MTATTPTTDRSASTRQTAAASRGTEFYRRYGSWAVVTGASDGIGRELAIRAAELGLNVVIAARRADRLDTLAVDLRDRFGVEVLVQATDLADAAQVEALVGATRQLDIGLVALAAGFGTSGEFLQTARQEELSMIDVNVRAVGALAHHYAPRLVARGRGGIVLMGSLVGFQGVPRAANYAATKAYVQTLGEGLRAELGPRGVDVVVSAPGPVLTGFGTRSNMRMTRGARPREVAVETLQALGRRTTVRPGFLAKMLEASLALLPRAGRVRVMAKVMGSMTAHQSG